MVSMEITSAVLWLDDGSSFPMRAKGDTAVVKSVPTPEARAQILSLLEGIGFRDVVWRVGRNINPPLPSLPRPDLPRSIDVVVETQEMVFRTGGRQRLSEMEFALMYRMFEAKGNVVSLDRLYNAMYGMGDEPENIENNLKVIIHRCRRKLGEHGRIECTWGRGYRLITTEHPDF